MCPVLLSIHVLTWYVDAQGDGYTCMHVLEFTLMRTLSSSDLSHAFLVAMYAHVPLVTLVTTVRPICVILAHV